MQRYLLPGVVLFAWLAIAAGARADYLVLELKAESGDASKTAPSETIEVGVKPMPRGVLDVKAGSRIRVRWTAKHAGNEGSLKNVLLHLAVAKEEKLGQLTPPNLGKSAAAESAMTMDFQPKDETSGELVLVLDRPGFYLLRLDTSGAAAGAEGHEHFAALDLDVR